MVALFKGTESVQTLPSHIENVYPRAGRVGVRPARRQRRRGGEHRVGIRGGIQHSISVTHERRSVGRVMFLSDEIEHRVRNGLGFTLVHRTYEHKDYDRNSAECWFHCGSPGW